jgi:hypothetical protein
VLAALGGLARADDLASIEARGQELAKQGKFSEAIDAFKEADRLAPRASHACLIALAYTRRELWPQAEIFFTLCHERATRADTLPDWLPLAEKTLAEHLASANVAEVQIRVEPAEASAVLSVSSFAADEVFGARTIHLAFGEHVITARAPGYQVAKQAISIGDRTPKQVVIQLEPLHVIVHSPVPWYVVGAGGVVLAAGAVYHLIALQPVRERLANDVKDLENINVADYQAHSHEFDVRRDVTIALYATGAATVITGLVLRATVLRGHEVEVTAQPRAGGGVVTLSWDLR